MKKLIFTMVAVAVLVGTALALEYAMPSEKYEQPVVQFTSGGTPLPAGSAYPIPDSLRNISTDYLIIDNGVLREKTAQEKADFDAACQDYLVAQSNAMVQAVADWNNSKTNHPPIILWENRFMLRLTQANGILMSEGIISQPLSPADASPDVMATYIIQATNSQASSVGIALNECDTWTAKITQDRIGNPPDGKPVRHYITSH